MSIRKSQSGFSIIEAMVALALFAIMIVGAAVTLGTIQTSDQQSDALQQQAALRDVFLADWASWARRQDWIEGTGNRPAMSVLDSIPAGYDFLSAASAATGNAALDTRLNEWRDRVQSQLRPPPDQWVLTVVSGAAITGASGAYRQLVLTTASGSSRTWLICCQ
ncbi:MAG: PulJ/GspJ family protein [Litorivicinus sp.]